MEIKTYKNASEIPEKYLPSLVYAEIECWGSHPFDEFMICSNNECGAIYSIEDVYGSIAKYRNRIENKNFNCECGCQTELFYKPEEFIEVVKEYFKGEVSAVLLLVEEKVEGFGILVDKTLDELLSLELGVRPFSYGDKKNEIEVLKLNMNSIYTCINHIYVSEEYRGNGYGKDVLYKLLEFLCYSNNKIILETRYDSNFYTFVRSMGFIELINDKYGYVLMELNQKGYFSLDKLTSIFNQISINFLKYKDEALQVLNNNLNYSKRKFYSSN